MPKEIYIDENGTEQILSSSPSALSGLLDTNITTPTANQVLAYDNNGKVVNKDFPIKKISANFTGTIGAQTMGVTTISNIPTGYIPLSAVAYRGSTSNALVHSIMYNDNDSTWKINLFNPATISISYNTDFDVYCIKA